MDDLFIVYLTHFPRKCILCMWNVLAGENADGLLFASTFSLTVNSAEASLTAWEPRLPFRLPVAG